MPDVIGIISGAIGIVSFLPSLFPGASETSSSMRLGIGLNGDAGGHVPNILVYNANYDNIGGYNPNHRHCQSNGWGDSTCYDDFQKVEQGQFVDLEIFQPTNQQPVYAKLEQVANDGICLAYITHTWPDGHQYGWVGDFGAYCGADWYESQIIVDNSGTTSKCVWLDKDRSDNTGSLGLHMWLPAFSPDFNPGEEVNADWYCRRKQIMQFYNNPDDDHYMWAPGTPWGPASLRSLPEGYANDTHIAVNRTSARVRSEAMATELVISQNSAHSASRMCSSPTSFGPDFLSIPEQLVCDMGSHTLWPLCQKDGSLDEHCFDLEKKVLVGSQAEQREKSSFYTKITEWQ